MYECVCIFVYNGYVICKKWYQEKYLSHVCLVKRKIMYNVQALFALIYMQGVLFDVFHLIYYFVPAE